MMSFSATKSTVLTIVFLFFVSFVETFAQTADSLYRLPAGTVMTVRMDNEINSKVSGVNDTFTVTLAAPVVKREVVLLPIGTVIGGRITRVKRAAFGGRHGSLEMVFQTLRLPDDAERNIEGVPLNDLKVESSAATSVLTVLGGTAAGGVIGAVSKAENGALLGAGLGAGAGAGVAFLRKGRDVRIKADETFEIKLTKDANLPPRDF